MPTLPTPILGDVSAIAFNSPDLERSMAYYSQLGFHETARNSFPFPWLQISDGSLLIMLRQDAHPFCSLTYYVRELDRVVAGLEQKGILFVQKPSPSDMIRRYVFMSSDGFYISLVTYVDGFRRPEGFTALTLPPNDFFEPEKYPNRSCGVFGEFAHPVTDLQRSIGFWEDLGFTCMSRYEAPYPWAIVADGLSIVGLHQTTSFSYPVITYFAADQGKKIALLLANGLTGIAAQGDGSAVLTTPEQQRINLFKIGI